jgi:hypothetical protein
VADTGSSGGGRAACSGEVEIHRGAGEPDPQQAAAGTPVVEISPNLRITGTTLYRWKGKVEDMPSPSSRSCDQLGAEDGPLKRLVADLNVDRKVL